MEWKESKDDSIILTWKLNIDDSIMLAWKLNIMVPVPKIQ